MGHFKEQRKSALTKLSQAFTAAKIPAVLSEAGTKFKILSIVWKDPLCNDTPPEHVQFWFDADGTFRLVDICKPEL
jgi:hypothetical protein